jgi:hypothetical protein
METSGPWFFWLFPLAFAAHNVEEAFLLPRWSKSAGGFHRPEGPFEFSFALVILTALAVAITSLCCARGKQSLPSYLFFAFNLGMFINVFFPHLTTTIVLRKYCPGLLTGVFLLVPTTLFLLWYRFRNQYYGFPQFWIVTVPFAVLIVGSLPWLIRAGRFVKHAFGLTHVRRLL